MAANRALALIYQNCFTVFRNTYGKYMDNKSVNLSWCKINGENVKCFIFKTKEFKYWECFYQWAKCNVLYNGLKSKFLMPLISLEAKLTLFPKMKYQKFVDLYINSNGHMGNCSFRIKQGIPKLKIIHSVWKRIEQLEQLEEFFVFW